MHISAADALAAQATRGSVSQQKNVHDVLSLQMTTLEQHRCSAHGLQIRTGLSQSLLVRHGSAQQQSSFIQIGRDELNPRKQFTHQHSDSFISNQFIAAGSNHHRVQHHPLKLIVVNRPRHDLHHLGRMQHANFDGVHPNIVQHRLQLCFQKSSRHRLNSLHTHGVLRRQSGDGGHAVTTKRSKSFQIGLYACAAARIRSSDGQDTGVMGMGSSVHGWDYRQVKVASLSKAGL